MSNGVTIDFPTADVDRFFRAMEYASKTLSVDMGKAMRQGVRQLLSSIAVSTKIAPKYRKVAERPTQQQPRGGELKRYSVTGWFGKPRTFQSRLYTAKSPSEVKERHARIKRRGLAKTTWKIAGQRINQRIEGAFEASIDGITKKLAGRHMDAKANFKGDDIFAEIHNSLPYIRSAFRGGEKDVSTAFDRAARGLVTSVDRQITKRMGLGQLDRGYRGSI